MKQDHGNSFGREPVERPRVGARPSFGHDRSEPALGDLYDEEADYLEPDRDTDYMQGVGAEHFDEEEAFEELLPENLRDDDEDLYEQQSRFLEDRGAGSQRNREEDPGPAPRAALWAARPGRDTYGEDDLEPDDDGDWEDDAREDEDDPRSWPLSLIIVGAVALLLLVAGGYGVLQERSATQEELRKLQAALATSASPEDVSSSRLALQEMKARYTDLEDTVAGLREKNAKLADTIAGLEAQLDASAKPARAATAPGTKPVAPAIKQTAPVAKPAPAARPATAQTTAATGDWFVNFSSYGQRPVAQEWAAKLRPSAGTVMVSEASKGGSTLYRVRVVGLASQAQAKAVARELEGAFGVSALWVGRE